MREGIGPTALARRAGYARTHYHALERGSRPLRPANAALFLKVLGVSGSELVEWGPLVEVLVEELDLEQLQALAGVDPRYAGAVA